MRDLRRQALESHKTVSRKAQSKVSSRASSAAGSRTSSHAGSRNASRHGSDEEENNLSDSTNWSTNSIDELLSAEAVEGDGTDAWQQTLSARIEEIIDRKRSSIQGRELAYAVYVHLLTTHYAFDTISSRKSDLLAAFLKSTKAESSEKETQLAIRAIAVTLITSPSNSAYATVFPAIQRIYTSSESIAAKTTAISSLGSILMYGGAADEATEELLDELLEIIESDGTSIDAADEASVVVAALESWGFLATSLDDMEDRTEDAIEAFVEQLESTDAAVQIAAGENIALLFEKSYTDREEDDGPPEEVEDEEGFPLDNSLVKRYNVYRQTNQLQHTLRQLAAVSSKSISRKDRKHLHSSFSDILCTVEHPQRGPRYQKAIDQETGKRYGSRMKVKVHGGGSMTIDRWWKLMRLHELRRVLGGGFVVHYEHNEVVFDSLPIMMSLQDD
ncbi:hypothetical protein VC83_00061 [Pseudogymnoascus destructans]|uniref:Interferon-related developmental regulator N-terminal domain-containing protein n=2 Tax=Pseudogymnoascus destructans TaxID=655981 RepID=L8G3V0_PSED2|nr:uncharacterized protein VC83_00061 [Pseudogymnoascus destructans]ELR07955.1 hypothetical protein GMDG_02814 [Pseudogymnoascus destructans 20631-21]OAF63310.1 hypothetical protein VC83_00061 [Pseudogymnoascus destructans]WQG15626.1 hypothetical protein VC83_00061 [Pseudogymnoascus destructans]